MMRYLAKCCITLCAGIVAALFCQLSMAGPVLNILTWEEYIDPLVVTEFEEHSGSKVKFTYFETEQERDANIAQNAGAFDVVLVSESVLDRYHSVGWVLPLQESLAPNIKHLKLDFVGEKLHGAPYMWGMTGIAYRRDLVEGPVDSWSIIFDPPPALQGRIGALDDTDEFIFMAAKYYGHTIQGFNMAQLKGLEPKLRRSSENIRFMPLSLEKDNALVTGDVAAMTFYNGDAVFLAESFNDQIDFVIPREGCGIWVDYWAIRTGSSQVALGHQFINFINEPKRAAANAKYTSFSPANKPAIELLPDEKRQDRRIFPLAKDLEKCEVFFDPGKKPVQVRRRMETLYFHLKNRRR